MALAVGAASGAVGAFIILRRMALVGDALSHVALPGIALSLAYDLDPFWGVLVFLLAAAVIVWWLEGKTSLPADALVGLLFTASLAVGILTIPNAEILESLFGVFPVFTPFVFLAVMAVTVILIFFTFFFSRKMLTAVIFPEMARIKSNKRIDDLILFLIFAFTVAIGIKLVGTLLMGALTIIPASIAKNLARGFKAYMALSAVLGALVAVVGVGLAKYYGFLPGPTIVLLGIFIFFLSFVFKRE